MTFSMHPIIGAMVFMDMEGEAIPGTLVSITEEQFVVRHENGEEVSYPHIALIATHYDFPSFADAIKHISQSGGGRHCPYCYLALLYATAFLSKPLEGQPFIAREELIRRGLVSYISSDYPSAAYSLFPQVDGITTQILHEEGLLKISQGYPRWTKEHPSDELHNTPCRNLIDALHGANQAIEQSRISHVVRWLPSEIFESLREIRNGLLHGSLIKIGEHQVAMLVMLLEAIRHGTMTEVQTL